MAIRFLYFIMTLVFVPMTQASSLKPQSIQEVNEFLASAEIDYEGTLGKLRRGNTLEFQPRNSDEEFTQIFEFIQLNFKLDSNTISRIDRLLRDTDYVGKGIYVYAYRKINLLYARVAPSRERLQNTVVVYHGFPLDAFNSISKGILVSSNGQSVIRGRQTANTEGDGLYAFADKPDQPIYGDSLLEIHLNVDCVEKGTCVFDKARRWYRVLSSDAIAYIVAPRMPIQSPTHTPHLTNDQWFERALNKTNTVSFSYLTDFEKSFLNQVLLLPEEQTQTFYRYGLSRKGYDLEYSLPVEQMAFNVNVNAIAFRNLLTEDPDLGVRILVKSQSVRDERYRPDINMYIGSFDSKKLSTATDVWLKNQVLNPSTTNAVAVGALRIIKTRMTRNEFGALISNIVDKNLYFVSFEFLVLTAGSSTKNRYILTQILNKNFSNKTSDYEFEKMVSYLAKDLEYDGNKMLREFLDTNRRVLLRDAVETIETYLERHPTPRTTRFSCLTLLTSPMSWFKTR